MKISIVIPVFNEEKTIVDVIKEIQNIQIDKEIIIVDDGSTDGTRDILKNLKMDGVKIFYHDKNLGKGAALKTGFLHAEGDIVIIQDADLEYDPVEYQKLIQPICEDKADVVYGSRFMGGPRRVLYFWHSVANSILTIFSNMMTNLNLTDMETGYKVFRREVIQRITITANRFGVEPELTQKISRLNVRVYEVPISYHGRTYSEGKKIGWKDAVSAIFHIIKYKFFS